MEKEKKELKDPESKTDKKLIIAAAAVIFALLSIILLLPKILNYIFTQGIVSEGPFEIIVRNIGERTENINNNMTAELIKSAEATAKTIKEKESEIIENLPDYIRNITFRDDKERSDFFEMLSEYYRDKIEKRESLDVSFEELNAIYLLSFLYGIDKYVESIENKQVN